MKKTLLFVCTVLLVFASGFLHRIQAQTWTAPTLTGSTITTGTTYYMYNVGSNGYLNRGGWYATQAVVTTKPTANASATIIKWTAVNTSGSIWTFQYNSGGSNVSGNYLFAADNGGSVYTDNSHDNTWDVVLTDVTTNTYSIQIVSTFGGYDVTQYLGSTLAAETSNKGIANDARYNRASGDNYTQWKFVSQDGLDLYNARVLLDRYMNYAKLRGGIDISSYITTYNAGVTADINTAAANLLTALGITSVTVPNFSFETDASQTGWTNSGSFANATNAPLFTKDGTNYTEKWTTQGTNLVTGTITQTLTGLSNGLYGLVASGHAVQQGPNWNDGSNPLHTGAFFTAGTSSTEISSGGDYNVDYATVTNATSGSNGTLTIGYALSGTVACNWTGFDNFRLYYYGAVVTPILTVSPRSLLTYLFPSTKKVAVTGLNLANNITITAPTGYSVSPSTLLKTVAGDSVAITYDGGAAASGYVVFTSGSTKDSVQVTGTADLTIVPSSTSIFLDNITFKDSITVKALNLVSDLIITPPAGITVTPTTITAPCNSNVKVLITYDKTTTGVGNITLTSGALTVNVAVKASSNAGCYTPAYASGNMIADPTFSATTLEAGGFGGWGTVGRRITHTRQYCGRGAAYILGTCWDKGGSLDRSLTTANGNALKPNTKYKLRAMVNSQASAGKTFQFQIEGVNGGASQYFQIGNTGGWKQIDTTFTTGATVTEHGIYFNSCTNPPAITDTCFIDNYELYAVPIQLSSYSLTFLGSKTIKVAVTGINLTNDITITTPTHFSVSPLTLLKTVAGDSVAIAYDGGAAANGYVVFKSGTIKDSVLVTGSADPTITIATKYLTFDELNSSGTFTVSAGNLASGITIAAPAGYTVSPATLASNANGATVTVTFDGLADSKGYITLTSGTTTARVRVIGRLNSTNFTPLYSSGNLITDPYFNSLDSYSGGWGLGNKSITTDTAMVYSGSRCAKITGACGSSIDYTLTGKLLANTKYRLRAMVNADKEFYFTLNGCGINSSTNDYQKMINPAGAWATIDFTFTTGTLAANQNLWMNSCNDIDNSVRATFAYLDNLEIYEVPNIAVSPLSLTYAGPRTKKVAVTGHKLTSDITITAPSGFSVTPTSLLSTVAGDSVAITYNNLADVSGYVVFASGSVKDSVQVTGTALSSDATLSSLTISDGTLSPVFAAGTTNYSAEVPVGTVVVPTITTATATETHAIPVITQATSTPGTATVVVTAQDGTTKKTYTVNFTLGAPAAPVAADATTVAKKSFSANWAASNGATGYFLDVATDNAFTAFVIGYNNLNVGNVTTYPVTDLVAATTYYYRVRATNGKVSDNSNVISVLSLGTGVQSLAANGLGISVTANAVELESNNAILSVQVVNVNGTLMTEKSVNATKAAISTEGWASGIYVFTIKTQSQVITTKLGIVK